MRGRAGFPGVALGWDLAVLQARGRMDLPVEMASDRHLFLHPISKPLLLFRDYGSRRGIAAPEFVCL